MTLRLIREPSQGAATLGSLYMDGVWFGWTLEDVIREQHGRPVATWKVPGATAIPSGCYRVILTPSQRFGTVLPLLIDVPGFAGVRIHAGNTAADTEGCILVGRTRSEKRIGESQAACAALVSRLQAAPGALWIVIEPPTVGVQAA